MTTTCFITKGSQAGRFKILSGKNSYHHLEGSYLGNEPTREIGMGAQVKGIYASLFHMHRFTTLPPCPYLFAVPLGKCSFFWLRGCLSVLPLISGKIHLDACTDVSHSIRAPFLLLHCAPTSLTSPGVLLPYSYSQVSCQAASSSPSHPASPPCSKRRWLLLKSLPSHEDMLSSVQLNSLLHCSLVQFSMGSRT